MTDIELTEQVVLDEIVNGLLLWRMEVNSLFRQQNFKFEKEQWKVLHFKAEEMVNEIRRIGCDPFFVAQDKRLADTFNFTQEFMPKLIRGNTKPEVKSYFNIQK